MKKDIITIAILILGIVIAAYFIGVNAKEEEYTGEYKTYTVMPGESLWTIASDICKATDGEQNIQSVIIKIKNDNGMNESTVYTWQKLKLRTEY